MQKLIRSLKQHWEEVATLFLLAFIPLYPKLPLFDIVQTWVYIRLDDFVVALMLFGLLAKYYRRKYIPDTALTLPIVFYWIAGLFSVSWSLAFIGPKLVGYFPQLVFLHYLRRIEYMAVFFLAAGGMRSLRYIRKYIIVFALTVLAVSLYGLGQRYMRLPAFLTMNEEFAKGTPLYLSPSSRITSTFAGHYDLAMYLAFAVTLFSSLVIGFRSFGSKIFLAGISVLAILVLFLTQSRISLFALGVGGIIVLWWHRKTLWIVPLLLLGVAALPFVPGLSDRFAKTFRDKPVIYDIRAGIPIGAARIDRDGRVTIEESASPAVENLPIGSGFIRIPTTPRVPLVASFGVGQLRSSADYPYHEGDKRPSLGEELQMALERGQMYLSLDGAATSPATGEEMASVSGRFFLDRALLYDISFTTRLQGQWPKAWEAFSRNIFLGSGYSVLNLAADSDYLRALGETGLLGFASFFFIFIVFVLYARASMERASALVQSFTIGVIGGLVGLLATAALLDVFEASKMAYVFWLTIGAAVSGLGITFKKKFPLRDEAYRIAVHPLSFIVLIGLLVPIVYKNSTNIYFTADDFTWLRWAAESSVSHLAVFFTDAAGFFYRPITKLYFLFSSLVFWQKPAGYHAVNLLFHFGSTVVIYAIVRRLSGLSTAVLTSLFFLVASSHHENVIWISGVSSLGGSFFVLLSLLFWTRVRGTAGGAVALLASMAALPVGMLFYEQMLFAPLFLSAYGWTFWPKRFRLVSLLPILFTPGYWWLRSFAHALFPSGSYGINPLALPFNVIGNGLGYVLITLLGPATLPLYDKTRDLLRSTPAVAGLLAFGFGFFAFVVFGKYKKRIRLSRATLFFSIFVIVSLLPVLGLGNIAERYGYLASAGIGYIFVAFLLPFIRKPSTRRAAALGLFAIFVVNYLQLQGLIGQWEKAGKTSVKILSELRRMYYPLRPGTQFVVAQVPVRIGRAWVFPVGLEDGASLFFYESGMKLDIVGAKHDAIAVKQRNPDIITALAIIDDPDRPLEELYE